MGRAACRDCHRAVLWTLTDAGKRLAVDPVPDEAGNTAVYRDGLGVHRSRRPTEELPLTAWEKLHMPHVATCPARQRTPKRPAVLPPGVLDLTAYPAKQAAGRDVASTGGRGRPGASRRTRGERGALHARLSDVPGPIPA